MMTLKGSTPAPHSPEEPGILLVDDKPANLLALEAVLEELGEPLIKAHSGEEALRYLLNHDVLLILLDVHMPGVDGFETAKLIKSREKSQHIPILFLTATSREEASIVKGYAYGAVDYVVKPFNPDILRGKVASILLHQRRARALRAKQEQLLARAEFARSEVEERLRLATEAAELGTWDWDLSRNDLVWDSRAKQIFGLAVHSEMTFERFLESIHADDRRRVEEAVAQSVDPVHRAAYRIEFRCVWPDSGTVRWVDARGRVFFDANRQPHRFTGTVLDITDRKRLDEAREQFIAILSHDLRNPLAAIALSQKSLVRAAGLTESQTKAASRIGTAAERMHRMIQDLLDFARARLGGSFPITRQHIRFGEVARTVTEEVELAHPDRQIEYRETGNLEGEWDGDRVAQVVSNLVGNALKHGADPIRVDVRDEGARVVLEVSNKGKPIPPEMLTQIFEPFRSASDPDRNGLGLGLFIVQQIVRAHGGDIEATSSAETGTVFHVSFPRLSPLPVPAH